MDSSTRVMQGHGREKEKGEEGEMHGRMGGGRGLSAAFLFIFPLPLCSFGFRLGCWAWVSGVG